MKLADLFGEIAGALGNRYYRRYFLGNTVSTIGRWMYRVAIGWLAWELTESTAWLGILAIADTLPMVLFSIVGGALGDRVGFLRIIRVCQCLNGIAGAAFFFLAGSRFVSIEAVVALAAVVGTLDAIMTPSRLAIVHSLVPREYLSSAVALGSVTFNTARFIGPAVAGVLIVWFDVPVVLAIATVTFWVFFFVVLTVETDEPDRDARPERGLAADIVESVRYAAGHRGISFVLTLLGVAALFLRPYIDLLPGVSALMYERGADGLSILMSATGLGALTAAFWLARRGRTEGMARFVTGGVGVASVALLAFTATNNVWTGAVLLAVVGGAVLLAGVSSQTIIQNAVDSAMRGRVMSLFIVISWGLPAVGAAVMGAVAEVVGLRLTLAIGALAAMLFWVWGRPVGARLTPVLEAPPADMRDA